MAAVNMQMMSNMPLEFMPVHSHHSRSNSVSSSSTHSNHSRPQSSHGIQRIHQPSPDDIYRATYHLGGHSAMHEPPPNHNITNPALKGPLRSSHYRARVAASPYPRDTDSIHSSSSETEDVPIYMNPSSEYQSMYTGHSMQHSQESIHSTGGAFGRMNLNTTDQGLEKLAATVRAATTTSASDRAKQIFVQAWLTANYATYPDGNVPRQGLYLSYRRVCDQYGIPHINTATLGKAIRLCFPTIKTRRLGVRGNSKYHYCGIRPATSAEADWLHNFVQKSNAQASAARNKGDPSESGDRGDGRSDEDEDEDSEPGSATGSKRNSLVLPGEIKNGVFGDELSDKTPTASNLLAQQAAQRPPGAFPEASIRRHPQQEPGLSLHNPSGSNSANYLSSPQQAVSVRQLPHFPSIEEALGSNSHAAPHNVAAREIWGWFQDHLDALLDAVRTFRFDQFEMNVRTFWSSLTGNHREIVHAPAIAGLMAKADAIVYDEILEFLRLQMLSPIPTASLASLRQLAIKMEKILLVALEGYGNTFVEPKVELGARFGHLVLRFLDIYQVTQALNTVLTNQKQLQEMRRSWTKVDFESVRNQSALVCNCRHEDLVQLLEVEFTALLETVSKSNEPVRDVMAWADKCCERLMGGVRANQVAQEERGVMSSRSVLIRWGYVTSQVMRDLTIRSDPAFGAFQILKLFLDDWIAVNVLRNVALSTNSVAASVEPMMQQQFFSLSPMAGQESFGALDVRPSHMMAQPTTSSMLAALQQDSFPVGSLDASGPFGTDAYGSMSYMDTSAAQDDGLTSGHQSGLSFSDFSNGANPFDSAGFSSSDLAGLNSGSSSTEPEETGEAVKPEHSSA
ncbi:hypothetical protein FA15DRAFT_664765 [Coprinopsis marcescibilis]|uniref:RFX-type winged-helix domain-containing protein n=1 Tax=Coprinopsis marcescibilis TaxID=230819 RepID=A0A5C3LJF5_COPMA|nr:hypothetical protein FA15DRAFT_664765 [Coprinopsis marcescibilis]